MQSNRQQSNLGEKSPANASVGIDTISSILNYHADGPYARSLTFSSHN